MSTIIKNDSCNVFEVHTTKIFIEFDPYKESRPKKSFVVKNISEVPQALFVGKPRTKYFSARYRLPRGKLLPNNYVVINVTFLDERSEARPYYDRMGIACCKGCAEYISLTAYPANNSLFTNMPTEINLGTVPLGRESKATLTLPPVGHDVPFLILSSECYRGLIIKPMRGILSTKPVSIKISYTPCSYVTVCFPLHIYLPSLTVMPYFLNIVADTKPGNMGELISKELSKPPEKIEVSLIRKFPMTKLPKFKPTETLSKGKTPVWSQHKINKFLMKKEENKTEPAHYERLGPLGRPTAVEEEIKKTKQESFLALVEKMKKEGEDAYLHKSDYLLKPSTVESVDWDLLWREHTDDKKGFCEDDVYRHSEPLLLNQRPSLSIDKEPYPEFTNNPRNPWFHRYRALKRFVGAARTILIQSRLLRRLKILKEVTFKDTETKRQ